MSLNATPSRRSTRPVRTPVPVPADFQALDQAHRAALEMLEHLAFLVQRLVDLGMDDEVRHQASEVLAYFDGPGLEHHAQEESRVFPTLLASGDAALVQHVHRLQQDHSWIEEDWRELAPQVQAIAAGYDWYDLAMLQAAVPVFAELLREHIALEECVVYPAAQNLLRHAKH
jgi:hemerythrin-like domain-containing protein